MKFLLIATALNLEAVYPDADTCAAARFALEPVAPTAVCIPNPIEYNVNNKAVFMGQFSNMMKEFRDNGNQH